MNQLVSTEWLDKNLRKVKILDTSWHLPNAARNALEEFENVEVLDDIKNGVYPMPMISTDTDLTYVGRLRKDIYDDNVLHMFNAADQVRVGAATNSVRIAIKWIEFQKEDI